MTRDGGVDQVTAFTVTSHDGLTWLEDDDPLEPPARDQRLLRRVTRPFGALAVVGVVALGIAKVAGIGDPPHTAPVAATATPSTPGVQLRPGEQAGVSMQVSFPAGTNAEIITNKDLGTLCPPMNSCAKTRLLPNDVMAAMRAVFPTVRIREATTVAYVDHRDGHHSLWYRSVHAVAPDRDIDVNIVPITPGDRVESGSIKDGDGVQVYTHRLLDGYAVQLLVRFSGTIDHPIGSLLGLPGDRRLLALS